MVRKRSPNPARAVATDEATNTATNTGAMALSAPTKRSPNMDTTLMPGTVSASDEPTTMPANIRSIKLVCCHFSRTDFMIPILLNKIWLQRYGKSKKRENLSVM